MTEKKASPKKEPAKRPGSGYVEGRSPRETATAIRKLLAEEGRAPASALYKAVCHVARPSFNSVSVTATGVAKGASDGVSKRLTEILETFLDAIPEPENDASPEPFSFAIVVAELPPAAT